MQIIKRFLKENVWAFVSTAIVRPVWKWVDQTWGIGPLVMALLMSAVGAIAAWLVALAPHWIVLISAGVFAMGLVTAVVIKKWQPSSAVRIRFEPRAPWVDKVIGYIHVPPKTTSYDAGSTRGVMVASGGTQQTKCIFVRWEIIAGKSGKYSGRLVNVEKNNGGKWINTAFGQQLRLRWVQTQECDDLYLHRGESQKIDLISTDEYNRRILVWGVPVLIGQENIFSSAGKYRITVKCAADNDEAATAVFTLEWKGAWDDFTIGLEGAEQGRITWQDQGGVPL